MGEVPKPKSFAGARAEDMSLEAFAAAHLCPTCANRTGAPYPAHELPMYIFDNPDGAETRRMLGMPGDVPGEPLGRWGHFSV